MFDIAGTVELGTICPGTGTWNRLQDGMISDLHGGPRRGRPGLMNFLRQASDALGYDLKDFPVKPRAARIKAECVTLIRVSGKHI